MGYIRLTVFPNGKEKYQMTKQTRSQGKDKVTESPKSKKEQKASRRAERKRQKKENKKYVRRIVPVWLKVLLVLVLSLFALAIGLIIGFTIIGDGGEPLDILKMETWKHIYELVWGE